MTQIARWLLPTSLLLMLASTLAAQGGHAAGLVEALADPERRSQASRDLVELGAAAVPALVGKLEADDADSQRAALAVIAELGPLAGEVFELLADKVANRALPLPGGVLALAELAPFRPDGIEVPHRKVARTLWGPILRRAALSAQDQLLCFVALERLRLSSEPVLGLESLADALGGFHALRVELTVDQIAALGPRAAAAAPRLAALLDLAEPRILRTDRVVPLHRKVARALLRIDPDGPFSGRARDVLRGVASIVPPTALASIPDRAGERIEALIKELADPRTHDAAVENLVALGAVVARPMGDALLRESEEAVRTGAITVLRRLGPRASEAVPALCEGLTELPTASTVAIVEALAATAPWCRDQPPPWWSQQSIGSVSVWGQPLAGPVDIEFLNAFCDASSRYVAAFEVDPGGPVAELVAHLESKNVLTREAALRVLRTRRAAARDFLPTLSAAIAAEHPLLHRMRWINAGSSTMERVDRNEVVRRLAAQAVVAIAERDDPLRASAEQFLNR